MPTDGSGQKWACVTCINGHRTKSCRHFDRFMVKVRKPGRPASKCLHNTPTQCSCRPIKAKMRPIGVVSETRDVLCEIEELYDAGPSPEAAADADMLTTAAPPQPASVPAQGQQRQRRPQQQQQRQSAGPMMPQLIDFSAPPQPTPSHLDGSMACPTGWVPAQQPGVIDPALVMSSGSPHEPGVLPPSSLHAAETNGQEQSGFSAAAVDAEDRAIDDPDNEEWVIDGDCASGECNCGDDCTCLNCLIHQLNRREVDSQSQQAMVQAPQAVDHQPQAMNFQPVPQPVPQPIPQSVQQPVFALNAAQIFNYQQFQQQQLLQQQQQQQQHRQLQLQPQQQQQQQQPLYFTAGYQQQAASMPQMIPNQQMNFG